MTREQQPDLFSAAPAAEKKRVNVPATSVEAFRAVDSEGRARWILDMLDEWEQRGSAPPTSDELAAALFGTPDGLYTIGVRRALSDALALNVIEHAEKRPSTISGRTCLTWRVKTR